jgi:hypothetical protein
MGMKACNHNILKRANKVEKETAGTFFIRYIEGH